ncbi:phospholipase A [Povalibacter sp.]|uniref:phospholipase A n=1 Tax=Povalibacter sp. TaxID=1962978 RepID=UPI002F405CB1
MRIISAVLLLLVASVARADIVLSARSPRVPAGGAIELVMTVTNDDAQPLTLELPETIHVRLETASAVSTLEFAPDLAGPISVAPREFARIRLRGNVPGGVQGPVTLSSTGLNANALVVQVEGEVPASPRPADAAPPTPASPPVASRLVDKPPPLAVSVYEPIFFIVGGDGGLNSKFQISLRYRLFDGDGPLAQRLPWLDDLYLSFSTTSLWDLGESSKPFTDSSYRPRLFYANYDLGRAMDGRLRFGIETGFGHESNGKDGDESRSFNMLYARPTVSFGDPDGLRAYIGPLIHNYIADDENPDIKDYRGYVDWMIGVGSRGGLDFWATLRRGTRSGYGSAELNLSYPLSKLSRGDLTGWLMLQYFGGYGESLLHYREKLDSQLRLGVAIAL